MWPLIAWRFAVAAAGVWVAVATFGRGLPARDRWPELALLGALYAVSGSGFLASLELIPAGVATLVFFTYPAVVVLAGALLLDEPLSRYRLGALVLTVGGCALTAGAGGGADPAGVGLALIAVGGISGYVLLGRRALARSAAMGGSAVILSVTAVLTAAVALLRGGLRLGGGPEAVGWTVLAGVVGTALPVTLFLVALRRMQAGKVALYSTVEPVLTVLLAAAVLDERMSAVQLAGGALVVAGVGWLRLERREASDAVAASDGP